MGKVIERFKTRFSSSVLDSHENKGDETILVKRENLREILEFAKYDGELLFDLFMDVCGVDYQGQTPRFEVVYHLYSVPKNHRIRIKVRVPEEDCVVPSCADLWKAADWFEREAYDMVGIRFEGHPNLKRVLLFEGFEGHPLRKDYPINKRQKIPEPLENP
ncbi:MAG: NADH-quinone oxidoreductase subunit C [bacterium]